MHSLARKIFGAVITVACASTTYAAPIDLDTSFSSDSQRTADYSNSSIINASYFADVAVTPDDKIIAVGNASVNDTQYEGLIVKHLSDGSIDNTFALNGIYRHNDLDDVRLNAVAIQSDGKILVAGNQRDSGTNYELIVLRLNNDGTLDTNFSDDGIYFNSASAPSSSPDYKNLYGKGIAINSQSKILIKASLYIGQTQGNNRYIDHVIKLDSEGALDTNFGNSLPTYTDVDNYFVDIEADINYVK